MTTQMSRFAMAGTALESAFAYPTNLKADRLPISFRTKTASAVHGGCGQSKAVV
jgi:hypothetical protein